MKKIIAHTDKKKVIKRFIFRQMIFLLVVFLAADLTGCTGLGKIPSDKQKQRYYSSPNFDVGKGVFVNLPDAELDTIWEQRVDRENEPSDGAAPDVHLPDIKPDFSVFASNDSDLKCIWIGHSSLLLKINEVKILIDPVFGRSSLVSFIGGGRFQEPPFTREELPWIDYVVISHDHYDHLEKATIEYFSKKETVFIVPLGVSSHLLYWGVKKENIIEKDWLESVTQSGIEFIAAPAWHSSGRLSRTTNYTQWSSWIIRSKNHTLFYSGDTGYGKHFREIGEKYGPFDVVFLECGQYFPAWRAHLLPDEWPVAILELKGKKWFPVHWGMFSIAPHKWNDPIINANLLSQKINIPLIAPKIGEIVDLNSNSKFDIWWDK